MLPSDLVLRDNELYRIAVVRVGNGMLENTNRSNHLSLHEDLILSRPSSTSLDKVTRISNDLLRLDRLSTTRHSDEFTLVVVNDFVDRFGEHVRSSVDGGESCESLREFSETVERVDVGRFAISGHRRSVEDDSFVSFSRRSNDVSDVVRSQQQS